MEEYEITGKKQKTWILAIIAILVTLGLAYLLVNFG